MKVLNVIDKIVSNISKNPLMKTFEKDLKDFLAWLFKKKNNNIYFHLKKNFSLPKKISPLFK